VLIGVDDVATGVGEEAADRRDQPRLIGAGEQQARGGGLAGDAGDDRLFARRIAFNDEIGTRGSRLA